MRKLTTIFLAGLFLTVCVLVVSAGVGYAQKEENAETVLPLPIPENRLVVTSVLAGRVLDKENNPISGVWVDCTGPNDSTTGFVTGPDGAYRFNLSQNGHYVIQLHSTKTSTSYEPSRRAFDVVVPGVDFVHN
ncbi:MAG TPA: carboxypeptidase-like regulatory domain-containing protein [Pyrinomonadaceae bacterium]|jgi:hypothetical protein|nr:carboxypeptidase-like regulatory domain-containing protein [Pyrinomonadaceae bacterium]